MSAIGKYALGVTMIVAGTNGSSAQELPYKRDIRDLTATVLGLKGLPSDLKSAVSDLSTKAAVLAAQHSGVSVRQEEKVVRVSMTGDILFDFDRAVIQPVAEPTLTDIAHLIASISGETIVIEGHTDSKGSADYNKGLSLRRAEAVASWLAAHGADKSRLSVKALGDSRPVAPNTLDNGADNPDGRALNRRVEFVLPSQKP